MDSTGSKLGFSSGISLKVFDSTETTVHLITYYDDDIVDDRVLSPKGIGDIQRFDIPFGSVRKTVRIRHNGLMYDDYDEVTSIHSIERFTINVTDGNGNSLILSGRIDYDHEGILDDISALLNDEDLRVLVVPFECAGGAALGAELGTVSAGIPAVGAGTMVLVVSLFAVEAGCIALTSECVLNYKENGLIEVFELPFDTSDLGDYRTGLDLPGIAHIQDQLVIKLFEGFIDRAMMDGEEYVRGTGLRYINEYMESKVGDSDLLRTIRKIAKYLVNNGEMWVDYDDSEPEWGLIALNITSKMVAEALEIPDKVREGSIANYSHLCLFLLDDWSIDRMEFMKPREKDSLVGRGKPFDLKIFPYKGAAGVPI